MACRYDERALAAVDVVPEREVADHGGSVARYRVAVESDHLEDLSGKPMTGLVELIWNSIDADATTIHVESIVGPLGGIERLLVKDDGSGMTLEQAREAFTTVGGSWKRDAVASRHFGRKLHGRSGMGRWRAFGMGGTSITWATVSDDFDGRFAFEVRIDSGSRREVEISERVPTQAPTGTVVTISGISEPLPGLLDPKGIDKITATFALEITDYQVTLTVDGRRIDPAPLQITSVTRKIDVPDGSSAELTVIEWRREVDRSLNLCDMAGTVLGEVRPGVQAPGFSFTAYLRWDGFTDYAGDIPLADLGHQMIGPVVGVARARLREYFRERTAEQKRSLISQWRTQEVYPYTREPVTLVEQVEQELFDIVAVTAAPAVNSAEDPLSRRLSLQLLRTALETEPSAIRRVLGQVLQLSAERMEELDKLLERTSLASIVTAARTIVNRLDFLVALEMLTYDDGREKVLERSQLHKILEGEAWVFGEEFNVGVSDRSLTAVLERHVGILGREKLADESPVLVDGRRQIVDLMLWRTMATDSRRLEHLVVELKAPSVKLGPDHVTQIKQYAFAVAEDARFDMDHVSWDFFLVSSDLSAFVRNEASQSTLQPGQIYSGHGGRVRIWAVAWRDIIDRCRFRLKFAKERLDYAASSDSGLAYLRQAHAKVLPLHLAAAPPPADDVLPDSETLDLQ